MAICSCVLATCSGYLIFFPKRHSNIPRDLKTTSKSRILFDAEILQKAQQQIVASRIWKSRGTSLFASPPLVWKEGKLIDPFENTEALHPPVPNWWLTKYHLEYWKPDLLKTDLKGDGFTVLENYQTHTDPTDPHVHAPPHVKFRLKKYVCVPFRIKFNGTPDDGQTFALNTIDVPFWRTQFLKLGESVQIGETSYILKEYCRRSVVQDSGLEVDVSELIVDNSREKIALRLGKVVNFPTCYAILTYLKEEMKIKKMEIFTLPQRQDYKYKLMDIAENHAVIEVVGTGEKVIIPSLFH